MSFFSKYNHVRFLPFPDVGEQVKGAVQNVASEIEGVLGGKKSTKEDSDHTNDSDHPQINGNDSSDFKIIPLKDKQASLDENIENMKNNMLTKAQSFGDEADKMADDIMKETEDLIRDAETGIADCANEMTTRITSSEDGTIEILNLEGNPPHSLTPTHSIDSLTSSPEPEIERILDNDPKCPPTPEATMNSLLSSSDGGATESETADSAATVVEAKQREAA